MPRSTWLVRALTLALALVLFVIPAAVAVAQPAPKTPTEAYLGYRAALLKAKSLNDLKPWLSKDGFAQLESLPADQRGMMFEMVKDMSSAVTNLKVVGETVTGDKAEVRVQATDTGDKSTQRATVEIVREGGVWKFVKEHWGNR